MTVMELRVALTVDDWERVIAFYRDALGLKSGDLWTEHGKAQIFLAGQATLEVFDERQAQSVDEIEVGRRVSGAVRFAFEVPDVRVALERAVQHGAKLVHELVQTPWSDLNARIEAPDGMQITLFQKAEGSQ